MKIYVTNNLKLCPLGTILFPSTTMYPHEIREALRAYLDEDDDQPVEGTHETCLATLNRTVLDQVRHEKMDGTRITYADVFVETERDLVPLLDLHDADWLAQSKLGTLFDHHAIHWLPHPASPPVLLGGTALSFEVGRNVGLRQGQEYVDALLARAHLTASSICPACAAALSSLLPCPHVRESTP